MVTALTRRRTTQLGGVVLFALLLAGSGALAQSGSRASETPAQASAATPRPGATVVQAYRALCLECHDNDGRGASARDILPKIPDFTTAAWQASRTDAELSRSILEGKGKSMPRMKEKLGKIDVSQVVAFVRGFRGGSQAVADEENPPPANGRPPIGSALAPVAAPRNASALTKPGDSELFRRYCAKCHGADGKGSPMRDTLPRIPDFSSPGWHLTRSDARLVASVLEGKGTEMPAFRGKLASGQARALVAVIRGFSPSTSSPAQAATSDFEDRFRALSSEFERLRQQSRELSAGSPAASDDGAKASPARSPAPDSQP